MNQRRRMDAEIRYEAGKPPLLHGARDDVEDRRPGYQEQREGGRDEQTERRGAGKDKLHDRTPYDGAEASLCRVLPVNARKFPAAPGALFIEHGAQGPACCRSTDWLP